MKKIPVLCTVALMLVVIATGCRGTEDTYRVAYERAKNKQVESAGGQTIYDAVRNEAVTTTAVVDGQEVKLTRQFVLVSKEFDAEPSWLKTYNVVAAQFKQLVHARSMATRLRSAGYDSAYIAQTREPYYYVIVTGSDTLSTLLPLLRHLETSPEVKLLPPCPWILRPANR